VDGGKSGGQQKPMGGSADTQVYVLFLRALQQYSDDRAAVVEEGRRTRLLGRRADDDVTWRPSRQ